jgi:hypothetical protein
MKISIVIPTMWKSNKLEILFRNFKNKSIIKGEILYKSKYSI